MFLLCDRKSISPFGVRIKPALNNSAIYLDQIKIRPISDISPWTLNAPVFDLQLTSLKN